MKKRSKKISIKIRPKIETSSLRCPNEHGQYLALFHLSDKSGGWFEVLDWDGVEFTSSGSGSPFTPIDPRHIQGLWKLPTVKDEQ